MFPRFNGERICPHQGGGSTQHKDPGLDMCPGNVMVVKISDAFTQRPLFSVDPLVPLGRLHGRLRRGEAGEGQAVQGPKHLDDRRPRALRTGGH